MRAVVQYLLDCTVCPPRASYDPDRTVSVITTGENMRYARKQARFQTDDGVSHVGSLWADAKSESPAACCIYLHSLGTNQFEVLNIVPFLCTPALAVFAFDFPGCGISEGKVTPLDGSGSRLVLSAARYLRETFGFERLCVWGRSMGAAVALHAVSLSHEFCCVVSDAAFESPRQVLLDQAEQSSIPAFFLKLALPVLKRQARSILSMDVDLPLPINVVNAAQTPLLMGHGSCDAFVQPHNAQHLFARYGCKNKQLYIFNAKHNSPRPCQWYETVARFIYRHTSVGAIVRGYNATYRSSFLHIGETQLVMDELERMLAARLAKEQAEAARSEPDTESSPTETSDPPDQGNDTP